MRGNPSGNLVPECEPQKGANWRLTILDAKLAAKIQQASLDTQSLVLDLNVYTKRQGIVQGENQKSY
jgi:hypothetical protein